MTKRKELEKALMHLLQEHGQINRVEKKESGQVVTYVTDDCIRGGYCDDMRYTDTKISLEILVNFGKEETEEFDNLVEKLFKTDIGEY